jgi:hypothetical protein
MNRLKNSVEYVGGVWPTGLSSQANVWLKYTDDNGLGGGEVGWYLRSSEQTTQNGVKLIWENPVQRKSPIAPKNAADKVDGDYYLPAINDMYIEIVAESQNYTGTGIKIGGKNLNTGVVSGNTTQKISVYSTASQQLTTGVIVYKTSESPSGFSGTKDKIELIGGKQIYRINPSTLTLASGTTYKARVWFRNSSSADNKYKEIKGITL